ncbi:MAG: hypothetical protein EOO01_38935 [Chitinophagaceae bacterium]|nr:MAG: hypothetical protein EOO01_38935 [Chitinophagaceae bacterium]
MLSCGQVRNNAPEPNGGVTSGKARAACTGLNSGDWVGTIVSHGIANLTADTALIRCTLLSFLDEGSQLDSFAIASYEYTDSIDYFLEGFGSNGSNSRAARINLDVDGSSNMKLLVSMQMMGESCNGDPCSHCYFKQGGGCGCKNAKGFERCNHNISK